MMEGSSNPMSLTSSVVLNQWSAEEHMNPVGVLKRGVVPLAFLLGVFVGSLLLPTNFETPEEQQLLRAHVQYGTSSADGSSGVHMRSEATEGCRCPDLEEELRELTGQLESCRASAAEQSPAPDVTTTSASGGARREPRKVYIDLGANDGQSVAFFVLNETAEVAPNEGNHQGGKDTIFKGMGASGDWEVIVIEANTRYKEELEAQRADFLAKNRVKDYTLLAGVAVATFDGNITFRLDLEGGDAGASTNLDSGSARGWDRTVPAVDLVTLFDQHGLTEDDVVAVKMDVEGSEFMLVRRLLMTGLHKRIRYLGVEWHHTNWQVLGTDQSRDRYAAEYKCLQWLWDQEAADTYKVVWE